MFQVQVNRNCSLSFLIFPVPMQSQWKKLVFGPQWTHICAAKELRIDFLVLAYSFIETSKFKSYHTSTGSHMFSNVKGHMSTMLNNLYLHLWTCLNLSWIFFVVVHCIWDWNQMISFPNTTCVWYFTIELKCCLENFQEKVENISVSLNFRFILNFFDVNQTHWFLDLNFEIFSSIFGVHFLFGLRIF